MTFQLTEVSKYPGWCMNWPLEPEVEPKPDLKFVRLPTYGHHTLVEPFQTLTLLDVSAQPSGTVGLGTLDGAANGVLTATAQFEDGLVIIGVIKGNNSSHRLLIPDREEGVSEIAKHWRRERAGDRKDDEDDEESPKGDGQNGDGLTVWEEYRGFYQGGQWRDDCYPRKKDLFVEK